MPPASPTDFLGEVSNFRRSCDLPVSANDCLACLLWRKLRGSYYYQGSSQTSLPCTQGQQCFKTKDHIHTLMGTAIVDDPYHYLLLPGSSQADWPVIGIEDPQVLTPRLEHIWDLAWKLAFKPYSQLPFTAPFSVPDLPVANHSCRIGIALNPASARSQHQMHIHIARIPTPLRQLFVGREENFGAWTKVRIPITRQTSASPIAYARYFSLSRHHNDNDNDNGDFDRQAAGGAAFGYGNNNDAATAAGTFSGTRPSDYHIFRQAFHFARRSFLRLQAWGILIIPDEEPIYLRVRETWYRCVVLLRCVLTYICLHHHHHTGQARLPPSRLLPRAEHQQRLWHVEFVQRHRRQRQLPAGTAPLHDLQHGRRS